MNGDSSRAGDPASNAMRVEETGIALVHAGELIVPAQGSEARLAPAGGEGLVAQYVFPVEIEVLSPPEPLDPHAIADLALTRLTRGLEGV